MKIIEYYLLPESGYTGKYDRKEAHYMVKSGTIAEMIHDSRMLCGYDFDKIIPCYESMNRILSQGYFERLVEWESIEIDSKEYDNVVEELLAMKLDRPYRLGMDDWKINSNLWR